MMEGIALSVAALVVALVVLATLDAMFNRR